MRTWSGESAAIDVQVFDILNVLHASGRMAYREPSCRLAGTNPHLTFQNVCSYYNVRIAVRYKW